MQPDRRDEPQTMFFATDAHRRQMPGGRVELGGQLAQGREFGNQGFVQAAGVFVVKVGQQGLKTLFQLFGQPVIQPLMTYQPALFGKQSAQIQHPQADAGEAAYLGLQLEAGLGIGPRQQVIQQAIEFMVVAERHQFIEQSFVGAEIHSGLGLSRRKTWASITAR